MTSRTNEATLEEVKQLDLWCEVVRTVNGIKLRTERTEETVTETGRRSDMVDFIDRHGIRADWRC